MSCLGISCLIFWIALCLYHEDFPYQKEISLFWKVGLAVMILALVILSLPIKGGS